MAPAVLRTVQSTAEPGFQAGYTAAGAVQSPDPEHPVAAATLYSHVHSILPPLEPHILAEGIHKVEQEHSLDQP